MKDQFVTYEIALALKELGFDEECLGYYYNGNYFLGTNKSFTNSEIELENITKTPAITAPLWQQVIDWFREKYNIQIEILWQGDMDSFCYKLGKFEYGSHSFSEKNWKFTEYNECREQAILKAIELCKKY